MLGALLAARRTHPTTRLVVLGAIAFGSLEVGAGLMPSFTMLAIALVPLGLANLTFSTAANSGVQLASAPEMRGRVMGIYMLVFVGGTPLGAPLVGWISQEFGARWGIIGGGAVSILAGLVALVVILKRAAARDEYRSESVRGPMPVPAGN